MNHPGHGVGEVRVVDALGGVGAKVRDRPAQLTGVAGQSVLDLEARRGRRRRPASGPAPTAGGAGRRGRWRGSRWRSRSRRRARAPCRAPAPSPARPRAPPAERGRRRRRRGRSVRRRAGGRAWREANARPAAVAGLGVGGWGLGVGGWGLEGRRGICSVCSICAPPRWRRSSPTAILPLAPCPLPLAPCPLPLAPCPEPPPPFRPGARRASLDSGPPAPHPHGLHPRLPQRPRPQLER